MVLRREDDTWKVAHRHADPITHIAFSLTSPSSSRPNGRQSCRSERLTPDALPVLAPRPAAWSSLAFFQLFLCPADAACSCRGLLGILDPTDELIARQRGDVLPGFESCGVRVQRIAEVGGELVHHAARHSYGTHTITVAIDRGIPTGATQAAELTRGVLTCGCCPVPEPPWCECWNRALRSLDARRRCACASALPSGPLHAAWGRPRAHAPGSPPRRPQDP